MTAPQASIRVLGTAGSTNSTDGAPNTLVGTILAVTPAGIPVARSGLSSISIWCSGSPSEPFRGTKPTDPTAPTSAPRSFTSAPGWIPSPRSVTSATAGKVLRNTPRYCISSTATTTITSSRASRPRRARVAVGSPRPVTSMTKGIPVSSPSAREPYAGVEAPESHSDQHVGDDDRDQAGANGAPGGRAHALRSPGGIEAEVAVDQCGDDHENDHLHDGVEDVDRLQEFVKVMQVGARRL